MSKEFLQAIIDTIDTRMKLKLPELLRQNANWTVAKVAVSGSGATVSVYIGDSTNAVDVKNSIGFSLTAGQLVAVVFPNFKNDNQKYIGWIL
jgi:hypothetical protein